MAVKLGQGPQGQCRIAGPMAHGQASHHRYAEIGCALTQHLLKREAISPLHLLSRCCTQR